MPISEIDDVLKRLSARPMLPWNMLRTELPERLEAHRTHAQEHHQSAAALLWYFLRRAVINQQRKPTRIQREALAKACNTALVESSTLTLSQVVQQTHTLEAHGWDGRDPVATVFVDALVDASMGRLRSPSVWRKRLKAAEAAEKARTLGSPNT